MTPIEKKMADKKLIPQDTTDRIESTTFTNSISIEKCGLSS